MEWNGRNVTILGVVCNVLLALGKVLAGILFRSQAIFADGLHSTSDLLTDIAVLAGLRLSSRPADGCHRYGHRRVATFVAMLVGAGLLVAAGIILYQAIETLHHPNDAVTSVVPLMMALLTIPVKELLFRITRFVGKRTHDMSVTANAWHHRSDAFSSVAAAAGLAGVWLGGSGWGFLDPLTAVVLAAFLVVVAGKIIYKSAGELVDRAPCQMTLGRLEEMVQQTEGVHSYHALRARQLGGKVAMDVHIQVDPQLTVEQGHEIASAVKRRIMDNDESVLEVVVHVEPAMS